MRKMLRVTAISVLILLSLLVVEAFVVQPVFADTVEVSKSEYEKRWKGWRVSFNVTNSGSNIDGIYDFHVSVFGATIKRISKPAGWRCLWDPKPTGVIWQTKNKPIWDLDSNADFDIVTDVPSYSGIWWTTNKEGKMIDQGSFTVSP